MLKNKLIFLFLVIPLLLSGFTFHPDSPLPGKITNYFNGNDVRDLAFDQQGYLWAATTHGVVRWDTKKKTYTRYTEKDGLPSDYVTAIMPARDGSVWVGGSGYIARLRNGKWKEFKIPESNSDGWYPSFRVNDILENEKGEMWFATCGAGAVRIDDEKVRDFLLQDGVASVAMTSVQEDSSGNMWFNQYQPGDEMCYYNKGLIPTGMQNSYGISKFDGQKWTIEFKGEDTESFGFKIFKDEFWIITEGNKSLKLYSNGKVTTFSHDGTDFGEPDRLFADSTGNIWVSEWKRGIDEFDRRTWKYFAKSGYDESDGRNSMWISQKTGLIGGNIISMAEDSQGVLWFATDKGIASYDGKAWGELIMGDPFTSLPDDYISEMAFDKNGTLWIDSLAGFFRLTDNGWVRDSSHSAAAIFPVKIPGENWPQLIERNPRWLFRVGVLKNGDSVLANYIVDTRYSPVICGEGHTKVIGTNFYIKKASTNSIKSLPILYVDACYNRNNALLAQDGTLWVGTYEGVYFYRNNHWNYITKSEGIGAKQIELIRQGPDGAIWFYGYFVGIFKYVEK